MRSISARVDTGSIQWKDMEHTTASALPASSPVSLPKAFMNRRPGRSLAFTAAIMSSLASTPITSGHTLCHTIVETLVPQPRSTTLRGA